jgi:hypothetical protein
MGLYKKLNIDTKSEMKESISDIFEAMKNEEKMSKKGSCNSQKNKISEEYLDNCESSCSDISDIKSLDENDHKKKQEENHIIKEKLAIVDKFYKKYPHLKKDKTDFVKEILHKNEKKEKNMTQIFVDLNEYVVEKIIIENKTFYRDEFNNLIDDKLKLAGFYKKNGDMYECYVFDLEHL